MKFSQPLSPATLKSLLSQKHYFQALKSSLSLQNPLFTDSIYALFIKSGSVLDQFLSSSLITHFSRAGDFSRATLFLRDTHNPDTAVFNSLISGYAKHARPGPAFEVFNNFRNMGVCPDVYTSSCLVSVCESFQENGVVHCVFFKMGFFQNVFLISGLVENYSKLGFVTDAEKCFEECMVFDSVVWTAMINGFVWNGCFDKARELFIKMSCLGLEINEFTLTGMLGGLFDVEEGEQVHGFLVKMGFLCGCSSHVNNALMNMYTRAGYRSCAVKVFDENSEPDVVSWLGRINAAYDGAEAFSMFKMCVDRGMEINEYLITSTLAVVEGSGVLGWGKQIHSLWVFG